jgi:hypothetical protein
VRANSNARILTHARTHARTHVHAGGGTPGEARRALAACRTDTCMCMRSGACWCRRARRLVRFRSGASAGRRRCGWGGAGGTEGGTEGGAGWAHGPARQPAAGRQTARARRRCKQPVACPPRARTACTSPPPPPLPQAFRPLRPNPSILNPQRIASQSVAAAASRSRLVLLAHYGVARQVNTPVSSKASEYARLK